MEIVWCTKLKHLPFGALQKSLSTAVLYSPLVSLTIYIIILLGGGGYLVGRVVMICFLPSLFHFTTKSSSFYRTPTSQGQNKNNNNKRHRYHSVITDSCSHCGFPACPDSLSLNIYFPFLVA